MEAWRQCELAEITAKIIIYQAFIEGELDVPKHLARRVHDQYFEISDLSLCTSFLSTRTGLDSLWKFMPTLCCASKRGNHHKPSGQGRFNRVHDPGPGKGVVRIPLT